MKQNQAENKQQNDLLIREIAHQLNNMLTIICSGTQLMLDDKQVQQSHALTESLQRILTASNHAVVLTNQLTTLR